MFYFFIFPFHSTSVINKIILLPSIVRTNPFSFFPYLISPFSLPYFSSYLPLTPAFRFYPCSWFFPSFLALLSYNSIDVCQRFYFLFASLPHCLSVFPISSTFPIYFFFTHFSLLCTTVFISIFYLAEPRLLHYLPILSFSALYFISDNIQIDFISTFSHFYRILFSCSFCPLFVLLALLN